MTRLLALFLAGFIGLSLRFIYIGEFELNQLLFLGSLPLFSVVVALIMKRQYTKDEEYTPPSYSTAISTRLSDRVWDKPKPVFKDQKKIATYQRVYEKWWQRYVADLMNRPGIWYLKLLISFEDGTTITIREMKKKDGNRSWGIYQDEKEIGSMQVDQSLKTAKDQMRKLYVQFDERHYELHSFLVGSQISLFDTDQEIAKGDRIERSIRELTFTKQLDIEEEQQLIPTYLFFNYIFGK